MDIVETTEQSASDSNGIRLIAAGILFILTLIMGTIPVYILEFSTKYFGQSKNSNTLPVTNGSNHNIQSSSSLVIRQTTNKSKKRWFHHDRIVQFLTQIGGGVLFYTAFVHMLPEIRENYESYLNPDDGDHHHHHDNNTHITNITNIVNMTVMTIVGCGDCDEDSLPLVDMCACAGLFGIFLLEELMHLILGGHGHHHHHHHHSHHNHDDDQQRQNKPLERSGSRQRRRRLSSSFRQCISGDKQVAKYDLQINDDLQSSPPPLTSSSSSSSSSSMTMIVSEQQQQKIMKSDNKEIITITSTTISGNNSGKKMNTNVLSSGLSETQPISSCQQQTIGYNTCTQRQCSHHHHHHHRHQEDDNVTTIISNDNDLSIMQNNYDGNNDNKSSIWPHIIDNFLLILAFSCHSIFDGISIGVQTKNDEIWTMLIAILSHKLLIAFILSFQIYEKCQEKITSSSSSSSMLIKQRPIKGAKLILWFFSTLFALMSPIGIIFIMIMNDASDAPSESSLHIIVLAAISAGTILYIVFFEIIDKTTSRLHLNGIAQWIALAIGFGLMHFISHLFHE
ncbi:hypothetical protein DERF_015858 [Dermatophagoides farinae]|uniref:Uncharacterized protein n=2 Tax=Dermatophagoides farinae TaxID=6954 RepID=A0A922KVS9_DERFA|nr:hypothetical protein DERF_015858 [Dermatophagoides farinae]